MSTSDEVRRKKSFGNSHWDDDGGYSTRINAGNNCKPSGYAEYDNLSGYVDRTYTTTWHDKDGNLWRKTCTVINLGRPDRGTPVDPDAQLDTEPWNDTADRLVVATAGKKDALAEREALLLVRVQAHLRKYGASTAKDLAVSVGIGQPQVANHLRKYTDKYMLLEGSLYLWGLVGVDYGVNPALPQYVVMFRATLLEHGPLTVADLCRLSGVQKGSATTGMARYTNIFAKVGYKTNGRMLTTIWGLVEGIHNEEAA